MTEPLIRTVDSQTPEYARDYGNGWRTWHNNAEGALERADDRNVSRAWYDGWADASAGRPKWTYRHWRWYGCDATCGYVCDGPHIDPTKDENEVMTTLDPDVDRGYVLNEHVEMHRIAFCVDCLLITANGETDPDFDTDVWAFGVERNWPSADGWHLGCGWFEDRDAEETEHWFSWSVCEGCGSHLGGDRYWGHAARNRRDVPEGPTA